MFLLLLHVRTTAQDLGLELEKRNLTKEAEVAEIVDAGLDELPGVTSSTTVLPNEELTPREVWVGGVCFSCCARLAGTCRLPFCWLGTKMSRFCLLVVGGAFFRWRILGSGVSPSTENLWLSVVQSVGHTRRQKVPAAVST